MSDKRKDYINWDEYFMGVAKLSGLRSKDPNTQVGCCIVSQDNKILSMGYNGLPKGCSDDEFPWVREGENPLKTKYVYTVHSELNAILNFHVMSVQKQSFKVESKKLSTTVTNMMEAQLYRHLCVCSMQQEWLITNTRDRIAR